MRSYRAAVLADAVCEAAVSFGSDLHVVGALEQQRLLPVACGSVCVGDAVLAVVCDVLRRLVGHQAHEGHLNTDVLRIGALAAILELQVRQTTGERHYTVMVTITEVRDSTH